MRAARKEQPNQEVAGGAPRAARAGSPRAGALRVQRAPRARSLAARGARAAGLVAVIAVLAWAAVVYAAYLIRLLKCSTSRCSRRSSSSRYGAGRRLLRAVPFPFAIEEAVYASALGLGLLAYVDARARRRRAARAPALVRCSPSPRGTGGARSRAASRSAFAASPGGARRGRGRTELAAVALGAALLVAEVLMMFAPPVGGDQTKYQLVYPRLFAEAHRLVATPWSFWGYMQYLVNMLYAAAFVLRGDVLARSPERELRRALRARDLRDRAALVRALRRRLGGAAVRDDAAHDDPHDARLGRVRAHALRDARGAGRRELARDRCARLARARGAHGRLRRRHQGDGSARPPPCSGS